MEEQAKVLLFSSCYQEGLSSGKGVSPPLVLRCTSALIDKFFAISSDSWPGPAIQRIVRPVRRKSSVNGNSGLSSTGGTPIVPAVWPVS
jgi:hypothetical protein